MTGDANEPALFDSLNEARVLAEEKQKAPVSWPSLSPTEAKEEWPALFDWVQVLRARYPNGTRLPDCWWQHNDLVEALSALRDCEQVCFAAKAPATAPVEWHRAFRDIEQRLETWIRRLTCSVASRGHEPVHAARSHPAGWAEFVNRDIEDRRRRQQH